MRKFIVGLTLVVVVVVAGLFVFAATFNVNQYHGTIQSKLEKRLGRPATLGEMHLGIFPPRFRVQNPAIGDDPRFSPDAPFIKAQEMGVSLKLWPLLQKQIEISSLKLERPSLNLIKNSAGVWNFASLGRPTESANPTPQNPSPPSPTQQQFSLDELTISDGQISILDQQKSKAPSLYDHIDITVRNLSPDTPFSVDAAAQLAGTGSQQARLQGKGGPIINGDPATTPFRGTLSLKQVDISDLSKFFNSPVLKGTDGTVSGEIKINNESGKLTAQGETQVQSAKLHGMELGYPITAQCDLTNDQAAEMLTVRNLTLKLGSAALMLSGTVNSKSSPALLDLNVRTDNISIAEVAKLAAASGIALSQGTNATGNANVNIQARGAADKPVLNGTIAGSDIQLSGRDIAQPIEIHSINLNLTPMQIESRPFNVASGGTTLNAQFTLRNYSSPTPTVDAAVRAPNAQLPAILSIAKAYGVKSLDKVNGVGTMNLDMHAVGPLKSVNTAEIMRALNGTIDLNFNNVKYSGANVSHELASIAGFLNANATSQSPPGVTNISKITGKIFVKNGIAETNNLEAKLDIGNAGAAGTANLVDETLNMRVTAVLSQSVSQKVGGNSVGGFMQTALANKQGELVVPALVTGTFSNPKFAPDIQQIAQMKVKGLVPNFDNPASVAGTLQNLLGGPRNPAQNSRAQENQQTEEQNSVQQLMGLFGKKKKPNQQPPK
jgi:AsmA protein